VLNLRAARVLRPPNIAAQHYWVAKNLWENTDTEKAAQVFIQAGLNAAGRGVLENQWFERAIEISPTLALRAKALTEQGRALERFGQHQQALDVLGQAQVLLKHSPDVLARAAPVLVRANLLALKLNRLEEAVPLAEEALLWLKNQTSPEARLLQSDAQSTLGTVARLRGQFRQAATFFAQALQLRQALGDRPRTAAALNNLGTALVRLQDPHAEKTLLAGVALCQDIGDVVNLARCLNNLGVLYNDHQQHTEARAAYERVQQLHAEIGDAWGMALSTLNLGVTAFYQNQLLEAKNHYLKTLALSQDFVQLQLEAHYNLGEVELALHNNAAAKQHLEQLLGLLEQIPKDSPDYDVAFATDAKALLQSIEGGL
jgi:tetratricopeptide (TPR) repeat protein